MKNNVQESWENFLNPKVMRPLLITASIYITAFESLKESIIGRIRDFYIMPLFEADEESKKNYNEKVLSRNKSPLYASLDWLKENGVIEDKDIQALDDVKECRNALAHDLFKKISTNEFPDLESRFQAMLELLNKIEIWWIVNVEIATDPDFDDSEIDESKIQPGPVMVLKMMIDVALGDEATASYYYEEFKKKTGANQSEQDNPITRP